MDARRFTVAVDVVVGGDPGLVRDEAGDDCNGRDVEIEEDIVDHHGPTSRCGHRIVSWDPASNCQQQTNGNFKERT